MVAQYGLCGDGLAHRSGFTRQVLKHALRITANYAFIVLLVGFAAVWLGY